MDYPNNKTGHPEFLTDVVYITTANSDEFLLFFSDAKDENNQYNYELKNKKKTTMITTTRYQ